MSAKPKHERGVVELSRDEFLQALAEQIAERVADAFVAQLPVRLSAF